jgi:hypothetical protein
MLVGIPVLILPTLWARYKDLDRLPQPFRYFWGNDEDAWDGDAPWRSHWNIDGSISINKGANGWWPDYLRQQGIIWDELSFLQQWWQSYKWCALRNPAWQTRNRKYLSTSVDVNDVTSFRHKGTAYNVNGDSPVNLWYDFEFTNSEGTFKAKYRHTYWRTFKRRELLGRVIIKGGRYFIHRRWGWKVYPELFSKTKTPIFKDRSVFIFQFKIKRIPVQ